jgi:hypothetical protein
MLNPNRTINGDDGYSCPEVAHDDENYKHQVLLFHLEQIFSCDMHIVLKAVQ